MAWHVVPGRRRSKAALRRLSLPKRGKPVWVRIDRGLSLGYRRIETAGPWIVRKATGDGNSWIRNFATADDYEGSRTATACSPSSRRRQSPAASPAMARPAAA